MILQLRKGQAENDELLESGQLVLSVASIVLLADNANCENVPHHSQHNVITCYNTMELSRPALVQQDREQQQCMMQQQQLPVQVQGMSLWPHHEFLLGQRKNRTSHPPFFVDLRCFKLDF